MKDILKNLLNISRRAYIATDYKIAVFKTYKYEELFIVRCEKTFYQVIWI